ncbi:unnamed protein product [Oikopleura dioica]|uniref:Uncharacterized protein n=1 Tax=Oikopleura dioica TaxID=34765 RepID=E4YFQ0_OIKDI|nr:unnamed protein product [Oikopleura dioica]
MTIAAGLVFGICVEALMLFLLNLNVLANKRISHHVMYENVLWLDVLELLFCFVLLILNCFLVKRFIQRKIFTDMEIFRYFWLSLSCIPVILIMFICRIGQLQGSWVGARAYGDDIYTALGLQKITSQAGQKAGLLIFYDMPAQQFVLESFIFVKQTIVMLFFGCQFSQKGDGRVRSIDSKNRLVESSESNKSRSDSNKRSPKDKRKISAVEITRAAEKRGSEESLNTPDIETDLHSITDPIDQMYRQYGISK